MFIHWDAKDDKKIQDFNYRATKEAIARTIKGEPKASEVTAKKDRLTIRLPPAEWENHQLGRKPERFTRSVIPGDLKARSLASSRDMTSVLIMA